MVVHLNEQKIKTLSVAAVLADEYMITHKTLFPLLSAEKPHSMVVSQNSAPKMSILHKDERECFYCRKTQIGSALSVKSNSSHPQMCNGPKA